MPTFVRAVDPAFEIRTVTVDLPPDVTLVGLKLFDALRELLYTSVAWLDVTGPTECVVPSAYVSVPATEAVLLYVPAGPITSTRMKQDPSEPVPLPARAGIVPPFIASDVPLGSAVIVGVPQVLLEFAGLAMRSCPLPPLASRGRLSDMVALVIGLADLFVTVMVSVDVVPSDRGPAGLKLFVIVNRVVVTVVLGVEVVPVPLQVVPPL